MSKVISDTFKEAIRVSHFNYDQFCFQVGLKSKQALSYVLNQKTDEHWRYDDIKRFCNVLNISTKRLLEDVDRQRTNS